MNAPLWKPSTKRINASRMHVYQQWLHAQGHSVGDDYASLYRWSIEHGELFWNSLWDYLGVIGDKGSDRVIADAENFIDCRFFPDATLNFAENILRRRDDGIALIARLETGHRETVTGREAFQRVATVAAVLTAKDIQPGDCVAAFMPNVAETMICMLVSTSIGATWTSCSPDFGINGVIDRFGQ